MKVSEFVVLDKLVSAIFRYSMLSRGDRVGVAVSGGADSVCLLHLLRDIAAEWDLRLAVLHLDHGLRAAESDGDRRFVEDLAARLGLPWLVERADLKSTAGNLEAAARTARREFFSRAMRDAELVRVATGHTLDDQAETVLFRAVRGSAPGGLRGILPVTREGIIRPMLEITRAEVEVYLRERGIAWREDSTNYDLGFRRNAIRRRILPDLSTTVNPKAAEALARLASVAWEEEALWLRLVSDALNRTFVRQPDGSWISRLSDLRGVERPLARRILTRVFREAGCGSPASEQLEVALQRIQSGRGGVSVAGGELRVSVGWVRVAARKGAGEEDRSWSVGVTATGLYPRPAGRLALSVRREGRSPYNGRGSRLNSELLDGGLVYRGWLPGDRLDDDKIKLKLQRAGVPAWSRPEWPVVASGQRVVWSGAFGAAEWAKAPNGAQDALVIEEVTAQDAVV
jgi:tRNA(Ile)-lysidine synthase